MQTLATFNVVSVLPMAGVAQIQSTMPLLTVTGRVYRDGVAVEDGQCDERYTAGDLAKYSPDMPSLIREMREGTAWTVESVARRFNVDVVGIAFGGTEIQGPETEGGPPREVRTDGLLGKEGDWAPLLEQHLKGLVVYLGGRDSHLGDIRGLSAMMAAQKEAGEILEKCWNDVDSVSSFGTVLLQTIFKKKLLGSGVLGPVRDVACKLIDRLRDRDEFAVFERGDIAESYFGAMTRLGEWAIELSDTIECLETPDDELAVARHFKEHAIGDDAILSLLARHSEITERIGNVFRDPEARRLASLNRYFFELVSAERTESGKKGPHGPTPIGGETS